MATIYGSNTLSSGFTVANSCRFDEGSSDNLSANSFGTPTSDKIYTLSWWFKRSKFGEAVYQFGWYDGSRTNSGDIVFDAADTLSFYHGSDDGNGKLLMPNRLFRDPSAWTHVVWAVDTTQGTASKRIKIYFNGVQETSFSTEVYPDQNAVSKIFHDSNNRIGAQWNAAGTTFYNGYMAEIVFIDGQQLTPTSFGEFDEDSPNIWKPIDVSDLTFGNNGFYLDFENSSALGNDVSGNNNDFTVNNLTAVDQSTDTCSNNFCTLNPLNVPTSSGPTFSEGNLVSISTNANFGGSSTIGMTTGKWYCEAKCVTDSTIRNAIGITGETGELARDNNAPTSSSSDQSSIGYLAENGNKYNPAAGDNGSSYGDSYANDDIIGIAMDLDNMKLYFSKNGTFQNSGDPTSGATGTGAIDITVAVADTIDGAYFVCQGSAGASTSRFDWNFGSPPYAVSSGNSDGNGHGNFEYSVPSGYLAWCTKNLGSDGG